MAEKLTPEQFRKLHNISQPAFGKMTVEEYKKQGVKESEIKPLRGKKKSHTDLVNEMLLRELEAYLRERYKEVEKEYRFDSERKYRFDFALLSERIAVEIEGGLWVTSRHRTGSGYQQDMHKYNLAASLGWWVYRFSYEDLKEKFYEKYL